MMPTVNRAALATAAGLLGAIAAAACQSPHRAALLGLSFSSPDHPGELLQPDGGLVEIAFGDTIVGQTATLTLDAVSTGDPMTVLSITPVQVDPTLSLPFIPGTVVTAAPSAIIAGFSPTSEDARKAIFQLVAGGDQPQSVTFVLTGTGVVNGLGVTPDPVDFGVVELGHPQSLTLTLTNHGSQSTALTLSNPQGNGAALFTLSPPAGTTLAPGASTNLTAQFAPLDAGATDATFAVNGPVGAPPVTVSLKGVGAPSLIAGAPVDFGFVQPGAEALRSAMVQNLGSLDTVHLGPAAPIINQPAGQTAFALSTGDQFPPALAPRQTASVGITFAPTAIGPFAGTLFVTTDDPNAHYLTIPVHGYGGGPSIDCAASGIDFSMVPIGFPATVRAMCANNGTDIPGHPEIGLQIAESGLTTTNPVFSASILWPDGGEVAPSDEAFLSAGQAAAIAVTFLPRDAGEYDGRLTIASDADSDAGLDLFGVGVNPEPCSLDAIPVSLAFGEVPPGSTSALELELRNTSQSICELAGISLLAGSDSAFSLQAANLGPQLLGSPAISDPQTPAATLRLEVTYAPSVADQAATGAIDVTALDTPGLQIPLAGFSATACLEVAPAAGDFGLVGVTPGNLLCFPEAITIVADNHCPTSTAITQIDLDPASAAAFVLQNVPALPLTLGFGQRASFEVGFEPRVLGPVFGAVNVSTGEFPGEPFVLPLAGDAEMSGIHTDSFIARGPPQKLDLLWVLDEDADDSEVAAVTRLLPGIIAALDTARIDYHIAVTSTDTCDGGMSDDGAFEPCDHCISSISAAAQIVTQATAGPAATLANIFDLYDVGPESGYCPTSNGDEHFLDAIAEAFSPAMLAGHNAGFLRPDAYLSVVLVNGGASGSGQGPYVTSSSEALAVLEGLVADPTQLSVSHVNAGSGIADLDAQVDALVSATGGLLLFTGIPAATWQRELIDLLTSSGAQRNYALAAVPGDPTTLQVYVGGLLVDEADWNYEASDNDIQFAETALPPPGSAVTVTYSIACPDAFDGG